MSIDSKTSEETKFDHNLVYKEVLELIRKKIKAWLGPRKAAHVRYNLFTRFDEAGLAPEGSGRYYETTHIELPYEILSGLKQEQWNELKREILALREKRGAAPLAERTRLQRIGNGGNYGNSDLTNGLMHISFGMGYPALDLTRRFGGKRPGRQNWKQIEKAWTRAFNDDLNKPEKFLEVLRGRRVHKGSGTVEVMVTSSYHEPFFKKPEVKPRYSPRRPHR